MLRNRPLQRFLTKLKSYLVEKGGQFDYHIQNKCQSKSHTKQKFKGIIGPNWKQYGRFGGKDRKSIEYWACQQFLILGTESIFHELICKRKAKSQRTAKLLSLIEEEVARKTLETLRSWKPQETNSLLELLGRRQCRPGFTFILSQWDLCQTSSLSNFKTVDLCCVNLDHKESWVQN